MKKPPTNFIGIGGQKCASTWIYDILVGHPEVCLSKNKELDFFSNYWDRGFEWYRAQFESNVADQAVAVGEVSPSYLYDMDAPMRVRQYDRDMKIIVTLRNPVERAYSNHKHNIRHGFVLSGDLTFESGLQTNPTYIEHGLYAAHLQHWYESFPKDQILVVLFDDIVNAPSSVALAVYRFLGIDDGYVSSALGKKSNESVAVTNVSLALRIDRLRKSINGAGMTWVWALFRGLGLRRLYRQLNTRDIDQAIPKMRPETCAYLSTFYLDDIINTERLLGRDLAAWKKADLSH
jgi:hypothetical protein